MLSMAAARGGPSANQSRAFARRSSPDMAASKAPDGSRRGNVPGDARQPRVARVTISRDASVGVMSSGRRVVHAEILRGFLAQAWWRKPIDHREQHGFAFFRRARVAQATAARIRVVARALMSFATSCRNPAARPVWIESLNHRSLGFGPWTMSSKFRARHGHTKADRARKAGALACGDLIRRQRCARSVVDPASAGALRCFPLRLQFFQRAVAVVGRTARQQLLCHRAMAIESTRLKIRAMGAANVRALHPSPAPASAGRRGCHPPYRMMNGPASVSSMRSTNTPP